VNTFEEQTSRYLAALHGADRENAHHRLIELGPEVIPLVTTRFQIESDQSVRSTLINIAWRTNSPAALPLLKEALDDSDPGIWKEALDGLIALGGPSALDVMRQVRARAKAEKAEWLEEAIEQIIEAMADNSRTGL
jgi:HEAT repeat protein